MAVAENSLQSPVATKKTSKRSSSSRKKKSVSKYEPDDHRPVQTFGASFKTGVDTTSSGSVLETATIHPDDCPANDASTSPKAKPRRTMIEMILEAIRSLKDRKGSSQIAIQKFILGNWQNIQDNNTFRSRLLKALKQGVKAGQLQKIKASYKVSAEFKKKEKARKSKENAKKQAERKKKNAEGLVKRKEANEKKRKQELEDRKKSLSKEELAALAKKEEERLAKQKLKEENERKAKERAERLRKRRFPMEDTKLHNEDKELGVTAPKEVKRRPQLPYFFQLADSSKAASASKCDSLDYDNRGIVSDLLQIYHFFHGDVGFVDILAEQSNQKVIADFGLSHLMYAVDEILNGNCKKSKLVPPLITHLFVACLQILTAPTLENDGLSNDLQSLGKALTPASWSEVCSMYMECMERYYSTSASLGGNVLEPGYTDLEYLFRMSDTVNDQYVENNGSGYFGIHALNSVLGRAYDKLSKQDPWTLSAEELLVLLRALTDDVLATRPDISLHISEREDELAGLLREKRQADSNYRKMKLAFEGPPPKKEVKKAKKTDEKEKEKEENDDCGDKNKSTEEPKAEKEWKPTISRRQFEQAKKDQQRANDAYERGLMRLVTRTEEVGFDRHFNKHYSFARDPEAIFVEISRSTTGLASDLPPEVHLNRTSWYVINKTSVLDNFAASLDVRGTRERALRDVLMGTEETHGLRRFLLDDVKEAEDEEKAKNRLEELQERLEEAKMDVLREEEGAVRRSGRFESDAQAQVSIIMADIDKLEKELAKNEDSIITPNFVELTGIDTLKRFESQRKRTRRQLKKLSSDIDVQRSMPCTNLIPSGDMDGSGLVGMVVDDMLEVELLCQDLVPRMGNEEKIRTTWVSGLECAIASWNEACPTFIGPEVCNRRHSLETVSEEGTKRRKLDIGSPMSMASNASQASLNQILAALKQPLLNLEERIYEVSGLQMAHSDQNIADDNMSAADEEELEEIAEREQRMKLLAWKKRVHSLRSIPTRRPTHIRETVVQAIAAARKAHLGPIVAKLRSALLLYRADAAGECKRAALCVLEENGDYEFDDEDTDEEDEEDGKETSSEEDKPQDQSNLCFEAVAMLGSLGDDGNATRNDWIEAVKKCKTISRFAALSAAFLAKATERLKKLLSEREALEKAVNKWQKDAERQKRNKKQGRKSPIEHPTEMWADVDYTDDFCMVYIEGHPWWPAKRCVPKDAELEKYLIQFDRSLVALVGEHGELRCVKSQAIKDFTGNVLEEDVEAFSKKDLSELEDSVAIARRIIRGNKEKDNFIEEKKTEA